MKFAVVAALVGAVSAALQVDLDSKDSVREAASLVAWDLVSYYHGNESGQTPGILPGPPPVGDYYWWEGGAMWGTLIDYWHLTGDSTYNDITTYAMLFQAEAPLNSYMPQNWTASLGNDDQGFWGMSAMLAAEVNYPNPPPKDPQWLGLAQAVFNTQAARWEDLDCGGGLRWQIPWANKGYDYKNTIANAIFFNLGARLARYTRNDTYAEWAVKTWDWMVALNYIDEHWNVFDGGHVADNCTGVDKTQFSYNAATLLQGAAFMYNYTNGSAQDQWHTRVNGLLNRTLEFFFLNGTIVERPCELPDKNNCNWDQRSFKGYMLRWMTTVAQVAPYTRDLIRQALRTSAEGAVSACAGGNNGRQCGFRWTTGNFDTYTGAGEEMSALAALISLIPFFDDQISAPLTNKTGGTSQGDPSAGQDPDILKPLPPLTMADTAGASVLTFAIGAGLSVLFIWMGQGA